MHKRLQNIYKHWLLLKAKPMPLKAVPGEACSVWLCRPGVLGDLLIISPFPRLIKAKWPNCRLTVIVQKSFFNIWQYNPFIDQIITIDTLRKGCREIVRLAKTARDDNVDVFFALEPDSSCSLLGILAEPRWGCCVGVPKLSKYWSQTFNDVNNHRVTFFKNLAEASGLDTSQWQQEIYLPKGLNEKVKTLLGPKIRTRIGVAPWAGSWSAKNWPIDLVALFCDLATKHGFETILLGVPADCQNARTLVEKTACKPLNLVGKTTILELAEIIKKLDAIVSCDSGAAHMAATFHKSQVILYGPTNSCEWAPDNLVTILENKKCGFCKPRYLREKGCSQDFLCMKFEPSIVLERLLEILKINTSKLTRVDSRT